MFSATADIYDVLYAFRDHRAEAARALELARRAARRPITSVLDVGCATGEHARALASAGIRDVRGIDVDRALVARARKKRLDARFHVGDMTRAAVGARFDAVLSLYGVVAYVVTKKKLGAFARNLARHLEPGGVAIVEPWCMRDDYAPRVSARIAEGTDGIRVVRASVERCRGHVVEVDVRYVVARRGHIETRSEKHELGLFSREEHLDALRAAGLTARFVSRGVARHDGVFVGRRD